ncbi:MAG TPA: NADPH-dependent F420 reductase [Burkholderiales bacterium]|nr:NADPH-dependent F420 reductase [Burkholderiales bacterium]
MKMKQNRRSFLIAAAATFALPFAARAASDTAGKLKIGILGSGRIGSALGGIWAKAGHTVMFSSLDIEHDKKLAASIGTNARAGTPREAAAFGDVILVAVPYRALPQLGKDLADVIKGKVLIDASNPIVSRDGEIATWAREKGAGIASAELLPGARIVRAFNAVGAARLPEIAQRTDRPGMPIAGDDANAIAVASRLIREVGFEPVLIGPLAMGKHLIPGAPLAGERSPEQIRQIAATLS